LPFAPCIALGQAQPPSESFEITAKIGRAWESGPANVMQLTGGVSIKTDDATMSADSAVVWLAPALASVAGDQEAQIVLLGNIRLEQGQAVRTGTRLYVTELVRAQPRMKVDDFREEDLSDSDLYRQALTLKPPPATTSPTTQPTQ